MNSRCRRPIQPRRPDRRHRSVAGRIDGRVGRDPAAWRRRQRAQAARPVVIRPLHSVTIIYALNGQGRCRQRLKQRSLLAGASRRASWLLPRSSTASRTRVDGRRTSSACSANWSCSTLPRLRPRRSGFTRRFEPRLRGSRSHQRPGRQRIDLLLRRHRDLSKRCRSGHSRAVTFSMEPFSGLQGRGLVQRPRATLSAFHLASTI